MQYVEFYSKSRKNNVFTNKRTNTHAYIHKDIELENNNILNLLQHAAKEATPNSNHQRTTNNIPYEIKKLVARSIGQRTHKPEKRRTYNRRSKKLKSKLQEMRNESFEKYVSNLKKGNNSIWKPIKSKRKPKISSPISKYATPPGP